jgi:hypothetical protein
MLAFFVVSFPDLASQKMLLSCQKTGSAKIELAPRLGKQQTFMAKKLLILSVVGIVVGLAFVTNIINVQNTVALYVVLPLGAVFLGLFLMFRSFEKEMAAYDADHQAHPAVQQGAREKQCGSRCSCEPRGKSAVAH